MGGVVELRTRPDRLRQDQSERLREALLPFETEMPEQIRDLIGHIDRRTASRNKWTFVMLSPEQNSIVVDYLIAHSRTATIGRVLLAIR